MPLNSTLLDEGNTQARGSLCVSSKNKIIILDIMKKTAITVVLALVLVPLSAATIEGTKDVAPADPNQYAVGDTIHYVMTITNPSLSYDMIVDVWDVLPDGSTQILDDDVTIGPGITKHYELYYVVKEGDVQIDNGNRIVINTVHAEGYEDDGYETEVIVAVEKSSDIIDVPVGGEAFAVSKFNTLVHWAGLVTFLLLSMALFTLKRRTI